MEAARHICEEARNVLSSLRSGPPNIARGDLAQSLRDLRKVVKSKFLDVPLSLSDGGFNPVDDESSAKVRKIHAGNDETQQIVEPNQLTLVSDLPERVIADEKEKNSDENISTGSEVIIDYPPPPPPVSSSLGTHPTDTPLSKQVEPFAFPFLGVILDPRAAGPHTLVALRSIHRLMERKTFLVHPPTLPSLAKGEGRMPAGSLPSSDFFHPPVEQYFIITLEPLVRGVLECRFEQTDAGADEAVEMAIADLLSLMVTLDYGSQHEVARKNLIEPETLMEAFNTVFVTRNTFVHSPALCYHFEEVLISIVSAVFGKLCNSSTETSAVTTTAQLIMEFLVNQLLHTPLNTLLKNGGGGGGGGSAEAHALHDATRLLCLRLIQSCLRTGWGDKGNHYFSTRKELNLEIKGLEDEPDDQKKDRKHHSNALLKIIQDDLCLSLLMIGQSIWTYQDPSTQSLPGMISIEVISEICSIFSTLWNIPSLRNVLLTQFENIFTGFYQRALSLLRRLPIPNDSEVFHANLIFDAEMEIILESLVDILCLHDGSFNSGRNASLSVGVGRDIATLENLFLVYDCNVNRSDVASGLIVELSRCCGGTVNEEGVTLPVAHLAGYSQMDPSEVATTAQHNVNEQTLERQEYESLMSLRHVPAHLRELCAEALVGSVKSSFSEAQPTQIFQEADGKDSLIEAKSLRLFKQQKRQMRQASKLFKKKTTKGIEFLVTCGILSEPVAPADVASFLRNGIVVGLDKSAVGEYLGEKGKPPTAGESPPCWQRDWFHKETLQAYCSSFHFENQSLLDGLRMFLAAFRLPGEAQQIDRILQAFADSCGRQCEESQAGGLSLLRSDSKKSSDGAYLLSFSIIMLNTDLHNSNIRADRKMTVDAFVKNNTDYGRDITDPGSELPREYLEDIYESILEEPIRTEGEGADGVMTPERWKDVLRVGGTSLSLSCLNTSGLRELIVENVWMPILSAIGGFWGVTQFGEPSDFYHLRNSSGIPKNRSGMLGAQGARLGMDLSVAMLTGLRNLSCRDIFQSFFNQICMYTGLLGEYKADAVERTASFVDSVERQSAVIITLNTAVEYGDLLGSAGWNFVWAIIFELCDLKLIGSGTNCKHRCLIMESDSDLLLPDSRRDWSMLLVKQCHDLFGSSKRSDNGTKKQKSGIFGAVGRAIFGSNPDLDDSIITSTRPEEEVIVSSKMAFPSKHGKEDFVLWDDLAASDVEDEVDLDQHGNFTTNVHPLTVGKAFENQLIQEDNNTQQPGPPITGLETYDDTRFYQISPRARVRKRLSRIFNFSALVSETRFLDVEGVKTLLLALVGLIRDANLLKSYEKKAEGKVFDRCGDASATVSAILISPASEALAEVLLCEIALKNRDRIRILWDACLKEHYYERLRRSKTSETDAMLPGVSIMLSPGIEKCLTGLLRICYHTVNREDVNEDVLESLTVLYPPEVRQFASTKRLNFDKHLAEGVWRICCDGVDGLRNASAKKGWQSLIGLITYCATKGEPIVVAKGSKSNSLSDDDPAFKAFRCLHLILNSEDISNAVPFEVVHGVREIISAGERQNCPKLSIAGLDLLLILHSKLQPLTSESSPHNKNDCLFSNWNPVVEGMTKASESRYPSIRQHSIAMLTDALVDRHGQNIPVADLCLILNGISIPMARQRIIELMKKQNTLNFEQEEILIELELCISVIFKPFIHHLGRLISHPKRLMTIWMSIIDIMSNLLGKEADEYGNVENKSIQAHILSVTKELASEHLRNAIMVLISNGVIDCKKADNYDDKCEDIGSMTWNAVGKIEYCRKSIPEWKRSSSLDNPVN